MNMPVQPNKAIVEETLALVGHPSRWGAQERETYEIIDPKDGY